MTPQKHITSPTEMRRIGPKGLIVMVIIALVLFSVALSRGGALAAGPVDPDAPTFGDLARLWANCTMEGRPLAPDASWSVPVQTWAYRDGALHQELTFYSTVTGTVPIAGFSQGAMYNVAVKGMHTLRVSRRGLLMTDLENMAEFGLLPEGDANNDNTINALDSAILGGAYWAREGDANWVDGADFNEDGVIDARDAALMGSNYWRTGDPLPVD